MLNVLEEAIKQFVHAEKVLMVIHMKAVTFHMIHRHLNVQLIPIVHHKKPVSMNIAKIHV
jgi:hypothetical protein